MNKQTEEQAELRRRLKEYRADHARAVRLLAIGNVNVDGAVKLERLADDRFIQFIADRDAKQKEEWEKEVTFKIKVAYETARAATGTEEGRKAIDFFYSVHLNSWPGIAHLSSKGEKE